MIWKADYGNSNWDIRHRFVASFVYNIPFFQTTNPFLKAAFAGWQSNGIITLQTGIPFNVSTGTDTANTGSSGTYRPDLLHAPSDTCGRGHLVGCIDATAYTIADLYPATPTNYAYGNEGRNLLHGPGAETVNFSLFKNFPIQERLKFQFRFETFALFNHTNFGNPAVDVRHVVVRQHHRRRREPHHPVGLQADLLTHRAATGHSEPRREGAVFICRSLMRFPSAPGSSAPPMLP